MFLARRKVISMRGGVYHRIRVNGIKHEPATSPVPVVSQASELFQSSSLVTLLEKNDGYNGEMGDAWNFVDPSISFSANVFAIHMSVESRSIAIIVPRGLVGMGRRLK